MYVNSDDNGVEVAMDTVPVEERSPRYHARARQVIVQIF